MGRRIVDTGKPAAVEELAGRIEHWRRTRMKRSPMPEMLWLAAGDLARAHGVDAVARWLRLDYYSLKRRVSGSA